MKRSNYLRLLRAIALIVSGACSGSPANSDNEQPPTNEAPPPAAPSPAPAPPAEPAPVPTLAPAPSPAPEAAAKPAEDTAAPHNAPAPAAARTATNPKPIAEPAPAPSAPAAEASAPSAPAACGDKGQPSCPLQGWMEHHLQQPLDDEDLARLAQGLTRAATLVPDPSWNSGDQGWATIARGGATAAQQQDLDAVRQSCKTCHKTWRSKYKSTFRTRPIPD